MEVQKEGGEEKIPKVKKKKFGVLRGWKETGEFDDEEVSQDKSNSTVWESGWSSNFLSCWCRRKLIWCELVSCDCLY